MRFTVAPKTCVGTRVLARAVSVAGLALWLSAGCQPAAPPKAASSAPDTKPAAAPAAPATPAAPTAPTAPGSAPLLTDTWDKVLLDGKHSGWVHTTRELVRDATTATIHSVNETQIEVGRFGSVTRMRTIAESRQTEAGQVLSFSLRQEAGGEPMIVEGRVEGNRAILTIRTAGMQQESQLDWSPEQGDFFAVEDSLRRTPMKPGEQRTVKLLLPGLAGVQCAESTLAAEKVEAVPQLAGSPQLLKVVSDVGFAGMQIQGMYWADERGDVLYSNVPELLKQEIIRTTREQAQGLTSDEVGDLGKSIIVRVPNPLPGFSETTRAVYEATLSSRNPADCFVSDGTQSVASLDAQHARITVRAVRPDWPADLPSASPPTDEDRQANSLIESDDKFVRALASTVLPEATDPWQVAVSLERWVFENIGKKNYSQGFVTASEVARTLEGDCTEHAVLLAALCRARQIPARVATGLVYSQPDQGFAFHMWNEVWINNRWVPLDATRGQGGIGADHLKFQSSNLAADAADSAVLRGLTVIHQLQLTIAESQ